MPTERIVRVYVGKTNRDRCDLIDVARRQADHLGRDGIKAKKNQTDARFMARGYLRFAFRNRAIRRRFIDRIKEHCHPAVTVRLFKR